MLYAAIITHDARRFRAYGAETRIAAARYAASSYALCGYYSTFRVRWQEAQPPFLYILFHPSADERAKGGAENDLEYVEPDDRHHAGRKRRA